jgi:high-affinity iron transporter
MRTASRIGRLTSTQVLLTLGALLAVVLVIQGVSGGVSDPTDPTTSMSHGAVVFDSGLLVFREGLESILVLAAVTASFMGTNQPLRRPVSAGAGIGILATIATWFVAIAVIGRLGLGGLELQAITGLLALIVLMVVMNWFFHKIYWTGWISRQNSARRSLMSLEGDGARRKLLLGLACLGFASVYREGFEIVLFLQSLRLRYGNADVLEGVAIASVLIAIVGFATFLAHHKLPYKRMLVLTGVMLGIVFVGMVGETVQEFQLAGWIPTTPVDIPIPGWVGMWFATFPTLEGLVCQALAGAFVLGSYFMAEHLKYRRPVREGRLPAQRPASPPQPQPQLVEST